MLKNLEPEEVWLHFMLSRLRLAARYVKASEVEVVLRDLIREGELRLSAVEEVRRGAGRHEPSPPQPNRDGDAGDPLSRR